jgi:hypothetical protein
MRSAHFQSLSARRPWGRSQSASPHKSSYRNVGKPRFRESRFSGVGRLGSSTRDIGAVPTKTKSVTQQQAGLVRRVKASCWNHAISLGPALVANALCRGRENLMMRGPEVQIGNSGLYGSKRNGFVSWDFPATSEKALKSRTWRKHRTREQSCTRSSIHCRLARKSKLEFCLK